MKPQEGMVQFPQLLSAVSMSICLRAALLRLVQLVDTEGAIPATPDILVTDPTLVSQTVHLQEKLGTQTST